MCCTLFVEADQARCLQLEEIFQRAGKKWARMSLLSLEKITGSSEVKLFSIYLAVEASDGQPSEDINTIVQAIVEIFPE